MDAEETEAELVLGGGTGSCAVFLDEFGEEQGLVQFFLEICECWGMGGLGGFYVHCFSVLQ